MNISDVKGKKVKILSSNNSDELEDKINKFMRECDRPIWNIQYQVAGTDHILFRHTALIIYD